MLQTVENVRIALYLTTTRGENSAITAQAALKRRVRQFMRRIVHCDEHEETQARVTNMVTPANNKRKRSRYFCKANVTKTLPLGDRCRQRTAEAGIPSVSNASDILGSESR